MATVLVLTGVVQVPPVTSTVAHVKVSFQLLGQLPDFVQIYAAPAGGGVGSAQLVDTVDVKPPENQYSDLVALEAGTYYAIYACPRTGPADQPDDDIDGAAWESYCAARYITTQTTTTPPATLSPPVITSLEPQPATVGRGNRITVTWSSSTRYDKFVVGWTQNGVQLQSQDISQSGTSGSWTAPTVPKWNYTFRVNGGISQFWNYNYSAWGPMASVVATDNLTSLRRYLLASGIDPAGRSLRSLLSTDQTTLRKFMQM